MARGLLNQGIFSVTSTPKWSVLYSAEYHQDRPKPHPKKMESLMKIKVPPSKNVYIKCVR